MVISLALIIFLLGTTRFLGPLGQRILVLASALALALLGMYLITSALA